MSEKPLEIGAERGLGRHALGLACVFAVEFLVFCIATQAHYAWIFPRWYDQNQYLAEGYKAYDTARLHGFAAGVAQAFDHGSPQGALHAFLSLLAFEVAGPSRIAALSLNLIALLVLQLATFCAVVRLSGARALGWAAIAALAALNCPWTGHWGSATDFRLDWMAACAFGTALAVGVMGNGFRSTRWAIAFGVAVGVVLLVRFLAAVYFCGIFVLLLGWLSTQPDKLRRLGRLFLSAIVVACVCGVAFWRSRQLIYSYYWIGHYGSQEGVVRNTHQNLIGSVAWMADEIFLNQIGIAVLILCVGVAVCLRFAKRSQPSELRGGAHQGSDLREAVVLSAVFCVVPTAVLLTHPEKAEPPADIIAPAVMWLAFALWISLSKKAPNRVVTRTCAVAGVVGALVFGAYQLRQTVTGEQAAYYRDINSLSDFLYFRSQESGLSRPLVSVTWMSDSLDADSFRTLGFERHGKMVPFAMAFPTSILEQPRDVIKADLARSDFVCVVTRAGAAWPIDRQMAAMAPELLRWCNENMVRDGEIDTSEIAATIFERRNLDVPESGVRLPAFIALGKSNPPYTALPPPAAPYLQGGAPVIWPVGTDLHSVVKVAYSPYRLSAVELPKGISLNTESGELTGRFSETGDFVAKMRASNALGSSEVSLPFHVVEKDWDAEVWPAPASKSGAVTWLDFGAYDASGTLDFIDITDLTERRVLSRLEASDDEHGAWHGRFRFVLSTPGEHRIIARTVRYDEKTAAYTYIDNTFSVTVRP